MRRQLPSVLLTLASLALAGCERPVPAFTPTPSPAVASSPFRAATPRPPLAEREVETAPSPSQTARVLATATPQPCATTPALPGAAVSLEAVETEVLAWFPARLEPRIEASGYVYSTDIPTRLGETWPAEWSVPGEIALLGDLGKHEDVRPSCRLLAFALGSFGNMPNYALDREAAEPGGVTFYPRVDADRSQVLALFDAQSGKLLGALDDAWSPGSLDWATGLLEIARDEVEPASTQIAVDGFAAWLAQKAPMPRAETALRPPSGSGRALSIGEVPEALIPIAEDFPLVVGSRWTYRHTEIEDRVFWSERVITDTIEAAWLTDDGALENWAVAPSGDWEGSVRRLIDAGGAYWHGFGEADVPWPLRPDDVNGEPKGAYETSIIAQADISVPAGHFEACYGLTRQLGGCMEEKGWFCPGVGWVWRSHWGCTSVYQLLTIDELLDYEIPELRPLAAGE